MMQLGLFGEDKDVTPKAKKTTSTQLDMFGGADLSATKTDILGGWRGQMALYSEDPRTEEEREAARDEQARKNNGRLF